MDIEKEIEAVFDADVTVELAEIGGDEGTVRFTVYCDEESQELVGQRLEELELEVAFETFR